MVHLVAPWAHVDPPVAKALNPSHSYVLAVFLLGSCVGAFVVGSAVAVFVMPATADSHSTRSFLLQKSKPCASIYATDSDRTTTRPQGPLSWNVFMISVSQKNRRRAE